VEVCNGKVWLSQGLTVDKQGTLPFLFLPPCQGHTCSLEWQPCERYLVDCNARSKGGGEKFKRRRTAKVNCKGGPTVADMRDD
jgi:hypothetical protein